MPAAIPVRPTRNLDPTWSRVLLIARRCDIVYESVTFPHMRNLRICEVPDSICVIEIVGMHHHHYHHHRHFQYTFQHVVTHIPACSDISTIGISTYSAKADAGWVATKFSTGASLLDVVKVEPTICFTTPAWMSIQGRNFIVAVLSTDLSLLVAYYDAANTTTLIDVQDVYL